MAGLAMALGGCSLLPVTKASALPPVERPEPGPGLRELRNRDGQLILREEYLVDENGKRWRHGFEFTFWPTGQLRSERQFDHDEPLGVWKSYWQGGGLRSDYVADPLQATPMVYFHPNGAKASEGQALRGRREGPWTYWYENGVVGEAGSYVRGERHGMWREFSSDGKPKSEGVYDAGDKVAPWRYW